MIPKIISNILLLISSTQAANILAFLPTPSFSHQTAYSQLWKHLSMRGHSVTLITTNPMKDPLLKNLTEIDVNFSYKYLSDISKTAETTATMWNMYNWWLHMSKNIAEDQLNYAPIQNLIHNKTSFDIVFVQYLFPEFLAFAELYECPKIIFSSMDTSVYFHRQIGNPWHPVLHPDIYSYYSESLNFGERVSSTIFSWYVIYLYTYRMIPDKQRLVKKYFNIKTSLEEIIKDVDMLFVNINPVIQGVRTIGPTTVNIGGRRAKTIFSKRLSKVSLEKLMKNVDMLFINVNPVIQGARAIGPSTINIGGFREKMKFSNPLPKELKDFLDGAKDGFIYFSLGSNVKSKDLNKESLKSIIESLKEMPHKVLWKFEADHLPGKPDNVKLVKWAPQEEVLSHPNIKLFVTQGGLQSMEEAIYRAVPMVVTPFFADQEKNANLMVSKGIAIKVERKPFIQQSDLKAAMVEVISNPSYKNSVTRLKELALDTPMTGLEKAIWWTEYVIRNKGAKHLRNPAADIPSYQYYLIDVISFLVLTFVLFLTAVIVLVKFIFKTIVNKFNSKMRKEKRQ